MQKLRVTSVKPKHTHGVQIIGNNTSNKYYNEFNTVMLSYSLSVHDNLDKQRRETESNQTGREERKTTIR